MKRMKISRLLNYLLISFISLVLLFIIYSVYLSNNLSEISAKLYSHPFAVTNEIKNININLNNIEYSVDKFKIIDDYEFKNELEKINIYENQIESSFSFVQDRFYGEKKLVINSKNDFQDYKNDIRNVLIKRMNKSLVSDSISYVIKLSLLKNSLNLLYQASVNNANIFYNQIDSENSKKNASSVTFISLSFIYGLLFLFVINTKIKRPIDNVIEKIVKMLKNDKGNNKKELENLSDIELLVYTIKYLEKLRNDLTETLENKNLAERELIDLNEILKNTMSSKERLFSIIAHDLINPFNSIIGLSQFLKSKLSSISFEEADEILGNISHSAINQYILLKNLLDWSRTQLDEIRINKEIFNLHKIVTDIIDTLNIFADSKKIELINYTEPKQHIYTDKQMILVVLNNIITNAIKYSYKNGKIFIKSMEEKIYVTLKIQDYGCGIKQDELKNIFEIGKKNIMPGTDGEKGSGLGLMVCKEFINKLGGKIWVESDKGKGSTFYISLPKEMYKETKLTF